MIEGVILTPLKIIPGELGDVMHALKFTDPSFSGFGEAYFSTVNKGAIKAWKRHLRMTLNLVVPCGRILFVLWDNRPDSSTKGSFFETELSKDKYQRLTVPPMIWMGFMGIGDEVNMLLNIANISHDPAEADKIDVYNDQIDYNWERYK